MTSAPEGLTPSHDNVFTLPANESTAEAINHWLEGSAVEIDTVRATDNLLDHWLAPGSGGSSEVWMSLRLGDYSSVTSA